jgi:pSer/pThr/pTyr-binding forkhead associated (FHA) protein
MFEIKIRQPDGNRSVAIDKAEVVIGRKNEARAVDVDLNPDTTVSRVHARVWLSDAGVQIEDLGSSLGTVVNGDQVQSATVIKATDLIQLGETVLLVAGKITSERPKVKPRPAVKSSPLDSAELASFRLEFEVISKGKRKALKVPSGEAFIGRANDEHQIDVDLSEDLAASRLHARVWVEKGTCWVEDLESRHGVKVNDKQIKEATQLGKADKIKIGSTQLRVQMQGAEKTPKHARSKRKVAETAPLPSGLEPPDDGLYPVWKSGSFCCLPPEARMEEVRFVLPEDAPVGNVRVLDKLAVDAKPEINALNKRKSTEYFRALLQWPRSLGLVADLDGLCDFIVEHLVKVFPGAGRASLFLCQPASRALVLKAHVPNLKPALSPLLAQQAIADGTGYIWKQCDKEESVARLPIHGGMCAPLKTGLEETGLLCVDTTEKTLEYSPEDLSLLMAMAQVAEPHVRLLAQAQ